MHYSVSAIIFVTFCSKNVECLWGVACYVLWSYGLIVFHSEFILNMPRLSKDQRVWVCLEHARFQNAEEVRRRDGRVVGVIFLPQLNEQSAQRIESFCAKRHATT
jgi:hypothetical protein